MALDGFKAWCCNEARHLIENYFGKLNPLRALATRYDQTASNLLAAVQLAAAVILLN